MSPELTPSQTVGPFFHDALVDEDRSKLVATGHPSAVRIEGTVYDGAGEPVPDAMVEIWQANQAGRHEDPTDDREDPALDEDFSGFGRSDTVKGGKFSFVTVKPGPVPGRDGSLQAPPRYGLRLRPRSPQAAGDPRLLPRREGREFL